MCIRGGLFIHLLRNIILIKTGQHKTRTAVVRLHLLRSPRFIPESVFYTKSVMLSPRFMPHTVLYTQSVVRIPVFRRPPSAVRRPQSAVRRPPSAVRRWPSAVGRWPSAVRSPLSAVHVLY